MNDQPINGAEQKSAYETALKTYGEALMGSMRVGATLQLDLPKLVIQQSLTQTMLDLLLEHYCATQGISFEDFMEALTDRLLQKAEKLPKPKEIALATPPRPRNGFRR